jgi:hypothetical protein
MLSYETYAALLGIEPKTPVTPEEMADTLNLTFFPYDETKISAELKSFVGDFIAALEQLNVNIIPYEKSLHKISLYKVCKRLIYIALNNSLYAVSKFFRRDTHRIHVHFSVVRNLLIRKRIKPGIVIVGVGNDDSKLPIDYTSSFTRTLVTTILDRPAHINQQSTFFDHFDTAMSLFAKHMTNVVIAVDKKSWTLYNFNASHPTFLRDDNFKKNLLTAFVSKAAAPMRPERLKAFHIRKNSFDTNEAIYEKALQDLIDGGAILENIGLFPKGKRIDDLPFKNDYYKWIGKIHLDQRSGMSYGFLAWQLPTAPPEVKSIEEADGVLRTELQMNGFSRDSSGNMYIACSLPGRGAVFLQIPEVRVLTLRSGCDKTKIVPRQDLLLMGIRNGKMFLETPVGMKMASDYRPSFDTKVILAHALGNAIVSGILHAVGKSKIFTTQLAENGLSICHWHGYIAAGEVPTGWHVHGSRNPHVACSTPQSALYAIDGKLKAVMKAIDENLEFLGDVHIEPHHGTNINFPSFTRLGEYFSQKQDIVSLGNKYHPE